MIIRTLQRLATIAATLLFFSACTSVGLDKTASSVDFSKGSIAVLRIDMRNELKPDYPPTHLGAVISKPAGNSAAAVRAQLPIDSASSSVLIVEQLGVGPQAITSLIGESRNTLIRGNFDFSMNAPFDLPPNSVVYLGHLSLTNVAKKSPDDQAAGSALPLIDQAMTGFGTGTLAIKLTDTWDADVKELRAQYPALKSLEILRTPLKKVVLKRASGSKAEPVVIELSQTTAEKAN